jgi:hypothetical protein
MQVRIRLYDRSSVEKLRAISIRQPFRSFSPVLDKEKLGSVLNTTQESVTTIEVGSAAFAEQFSAPSPKSREDASVLNREGELLESAPNFTGLAISRTEWLNSKEVVKVGIKLGKQLSEVLGMRRSRVLPND